MRDVGNWPFKQALDYHPGRKRKIRLAVVHATATGETSRVAETIQQTWTTDDGRDASAHTIGDDDSIVRSVHDADTAWAAKGANADGLHHEIVGQATQNTIQWDDTFSRKAIGNAATVIAAWCVEHNLPVRRLTVEQVRDGVTRGLTDHATISKAFPGTGHTDPGPDFPWAKFLTRVRAEVARLTTPPAQEDEMTADDLKKIQAMIDGAVDKLHQEHVLILHGDEHHPISLDSIARKLGMTPA